MRSGATASCSSRPPAPATHARDRLGLLGAVALGLLCGIGLHRAPRLRRAIEPLLVGSQAVPVPILAPLLVVWLGFGLMPQLVLVVVIAFFPLAVATRDALAGLAPETDLVLPQPWGLAAPASAPR